MKHAKSTNAPSIWHLQKKSDAVDHCQAAFEFVLIVAGDRSLGENDGRLVGFKKKEPKE
jgi:hypothetical protein